MKDEIRRYLTKHRANEEAAEFGDSDSLLESGVLDSMAMVEFITYLESEFGIAVDEDDMIPEHFDSVEAIVAYVQRKREETVSSENDALAGESARP